MGSNLRHLLAPSSQPQQHKQSQADYQGALSLPRMPQLDDISQQPQHTLINHRSSALPARPRTPPQQPGLRSPPASAPSQRPAWTSVNNEEPPADSRSILNPPDDVSSEGSVNRGLPLQVVPLSAPAPSQSAPTPVPAINPDASTNGVHANGHSIHHLLTPPSQHAHQASAFGVIRPSGQYLNYASPPAEAQAPSRTQKPPKQRVRFASPCDPSKMAPPVTSSALPPADAGRPGEPDGYTTRTPPAHEGAADQSDLRGQAPAVNPPEPAEPEHPEVDLLKFQTLCNRCKELREKIQAEQLQNPTRGLRQNIRECMRRGEEVTQNCPVCSPSAGVTDGHHQPNGSNGDRVPPKRKSPSDAGDEQEPRPKFRKVTPDGPAAPAQGSSRQRSPTADRFRAGEFSNARFSPVDIPNRQVSAHLPPQTASEPEGTPGGGLQAPISSRMRPNTAGTQSDWGERVAHRADGGHGLSNTQGTTTDSLPTTDAGSR